jgi:hypothetical protein
LLSDLLGRDERAETDVEAERPVVQGRLLRDEGDGAAVAFDVETADVVTVDDNTPLKRVTVEGEYGQWVFGSREETPRLCTRSAI